MHAGCSPKHHSYFSRVNHCRHNFCWCYHSPKSEDQWVNWCELVECSGALPLSKTPAHETSLASNSTTLLWLFRWPPTTKQFTVSLTGGHFAARPKILIWSIPFVLVCSVLFFLLCCSHSINRNEIQACPSQTRASVTFWFSSRNIDQRNRQTGSVYI